MSWIRWSRSADGSVPSSRPVNSSARQAADVVSWPSRAPGLRQVPGRPPVAPVGVPAWDRPWCAVVLTVLVASVLTSSRTVIGNDDLPQFALARQRGLSWRLLTSSIFEHFAPLNRVAHWFAIKVSPLDVRIPHLLAIVTLAIFLASLSSLLGALGTPPSRRAVLVVLSGTCVPVIDTMSWMDGAMQWLPLLATLTVFLLLHVRYVKRRTIFRALGSVAGLGLCMLADIRFVLAVPLAVGVHLFLMERGPFTRRLRAGLRDLPYYAVLSGLLLWAALTIQRLYSNPRVRPLPAAHRAGEIAHVGWYALTSYGPERLLGLWRVAPLPTAVAITVALAGLTGLAVLVRVNRQNIYPIAFAALAAVLAYGLLFESDLLKAGAAWNARRSDYMLPALLPILLAGASLRGRIAPSKRSDPGTWRAAVRSSSPGVAALLAVVLAVLPAVHWLNSGITFSGLLDGSSTSYFNHLRSGERAWDNSANTLVELQAPRRVSLPRDSHQGAESFLLQLIDPSWVNAPLGPHPVILDDQGVPQAARLLPVSTSSTISLCALSTPGPSVVTFASPVVGRPLFARLTVISDRTVSLHVFPVDGVRRARDLSPTRVTAGIHDWLVNLPVPRFDRLEISTDDGSTMPCVSAVSIVQVAAAGHGTQCTLVGPYGSPGPLTQCPAPAASEPLAGSGDFMSPRLRGLPAPHAHRAAFQNTTGTATSKTSTGRAR